MYCVNTAIMYIHYINYTLYYYSGTITIYVIFMIMINHNP